MVGHNAAVELRWCDSRRSAVGYQWANIVRVSLICDALAGDRDGVMLIIGCESAGDGGVNTKVDVMCGTLKVLLFISNLISAMLGRYIYPTSS